MLNIVKTNSSSQQLSDSHSFSLVSKILNVYFLKFERGADASSLGTVHMISGTELRGKFIPDGACISETTASEATIRQTSPVQWPERLHALLLLVHNFVDLLELVFVPFECRIIIHFYIGVVGPILHFGIGPNTMVLASRIAIFVAHTGG